jgi:CPA2 family monovalent cation:H+ antiporter-2
MFFIYYIYIMENALLFTVLLLSCGLICTEICSMIGVSPSVGYILSGIIINKTICVEAYSTTLEIINETAIGFLMFIIGMKISKKELSVLKSYTIFSVAQIILSGLFIIPVLRYFLPSIQPELAIIIAGSISLSSTALCVQLINEKKQYNTTSSNATMAALIIQDFFAIIMLIGLQTILLINTAPINVWSIVSWLKILLSYIQSVFFVLGIIFVANPVTNYCLKFLSISKSSESIIIFCLVFVLGSSVITRSFGLSTELGPFIAGLLIAGTKYKELIMNEIYNPSKVLLGLFFMSVGMSIEISLVFQEIKTISLLLLSILTIKGIIAGGLFFFLNKNIKEAIKTSVLLSGIGEFTFVIIHNIPLNMIAEKNIKILIAATTISMLFTAIIYGFLCIKNLNKNKRGNYEVVIIGITEKTQIIASFLQSLGIKYLLVDRSSTRIDGATKKGFETTFGDGENIKFLKLITDSCRVIIVGFEINHGRVDIIRKIRSVSEDAHVICFTSNEEVVKRVNFPKVEVLIFSKMEQGFKIITNLLEKLGWSSIEARDAIEKIPHS